MTRLRTSRGPSHDATLKATFKLLDCLIGQYKLNMTDDILSEVAISLPRYIGLQP